MTALVEEDVVGKALMEEDVVGKALVGEALVGEGLSSEGHSSGAVLPVSQGHISVSSESFGL